MKEFQVNKFITLKLEDGKTNIYIDGELFEQCRFLLVNIPIDEISYFDEIDSVDEVSENLSKKMEKRGWGENKIHDIKISPEVEFWAHSSNLQVWIEHEYDTRLIHSNLAFPVLKKLAEVGDPMAKKIFKEEIAKRLESGYWPVIEYLINEEYTDYFSREEFLQCILEDENEIQFLLEIEKLNGIRFYLEKKLSGEYNNFTVKNKRIVGLCIDSLNIKNVLLTISNLKHLKRLHLIGNSINVLPNSLGELDKLEVLNLIGNDLKNLPEKTKNLSSLTHLDLGSNEFEFLSEVIREMQSLKTLIVSNNKLVTIPNYLLKLKKLEKVILTKNQLNENSKIIEDLMKKGVKVKI